MTDLDERLNAAVSHLQVHLDAARVAPASAIHRRHRRRQRGVFAAATVLGVLGVAGLGVVVTRDVGSIEPASAPVDPARVLADSLLFPADGSGVQAAEVVVGPPALTGAAGLVRSPDGALFKIGIMDASGELTPGTERRQFNGREYDAEIVEGAVSYQSLSECARVSVLRSGPDPATWDDDALTLLAALTVDGQSGTVDLPAGWTSLGAGVPAMRLQLPLGGTVNGVTVAGNLTQFPQTAVAFVVQGNLNPVTINGHAAWTSTGSGITDLVWNDNGNAVELISDSTADELIQLASTLEHGHADQWLPYINTPTNEAAPNGTSPDNESTPPTCGPANLTINSGSR